MYCICTRLTEVRHLSPLPLPQYIASPQFSTQLVTAPVRLRVTATNSLAFSAWHMCEALSKQGNSAPKATAAGFWFCLFCFREKLSPPVPGFPRCLHACLTSPSSYTIKAGWSSFWSTISSRYQLSKWNKVVQCSEHTRRVKPLFSISYRAVTSWPCHAHCVA